MLLIKKGYRPITYENKSTLILSKGNKFFRYWLLDDKLEYLTEVPYTFKFWFSAMNPIFRRVLRGELRNGVVFDGTFYFTYNSRLWHIPLRSPEPVQPTVIFEFVNGKGPLHFAVVDHKKSLETGFDCGVYFGEYFSNEAKSEVNLYKVTKDSKIHRVYTFKEGQINHIHNIVFDSHRRCAWILCGDFGKAAGIWRVENNFSNIKCIVRGQQNMRSCIAFPIREGLLYATDSQLEPNSIRLLRLDGLEISTTTLHTINGPCIYGREVMDGFIFTTATEPNVNSAKLSLRDFFKIKPGPGILSNKSVVYYVSRELSIKELFDHKKDCWPYYLAQFGNICLPSGNADSNHLVSYSIANQVNDQCMEVRRLEHL